MDSAHGQALVDNLVQQNASIYAALRFVPLAGHQVFLDNSDSFNRMMVQEIHHVMQL